jgi:hypothetical protein
VLPSRHGPDRFRRTRRVGRGKKGQGERGLQDRAARDIGLLPSVQRG